MNKFIGYIFCILLVASGGMAASSPVLAQNGSEQDVSNVDQNVVVEDVEGLRINLVQNIQDPGSKRMRFEVLIDPTISSDRVEVSWVVSGESVLYEGNAKEVIQLQAGTQATHSVVVEPVGFGVSRVKVIVQAYEIDGTRVATGAKAFVTDRERALLLPDAQQQLANNVYLARNVAAIVLSIIVLITIVYLAYGYFRAWLDSDKT